MGTNKIPSGAAPLEQRVEPHKVWYGLWYVRNFPVARLGGKLDKDPSERPWIMGLLADLKKTGRFFNPVIVWNHHPLRGRKQPYWLLRAGSNRIWCAEQLGWTHVPAIVSVDPHDELADRHMMVVHGEPISPGSVQSYFVDGGNIWANEHGFGLLRAKKPEDTYAQYIPTSTELSELRPTEHGCVKIMNPLVDE